jgi:hypothetical protein
MQNHTFCRNLQYMEEQKIIKEIGLNGQEITYIVDPSLNGVAERMKVPEKYKDFNEVHLPVIKKFLEEKGWL